MKIYNATILFNQRQNKSFRYIPRYSREKPSDTHQVSPDDAKDVISKWKKGSDLNRRKVGGVLPIKILIVVLVLLLICMYVLDKKYM